MRWEYYHFLFSPACLPAVDGAKVWSTHKIAETHTHTEADRHTGFGFIFLHWWSVFTMFFLLRHLLWKTKWFHFQCEIDPVISDLLRNWIDFIGIENAIILKLNWWCCARFCCFAEIIDFRWVSMGVIEVVITEKCIPSFLEIKSRHTRLTRARPLLIRF